ncbi:hypothetical protein GCM10011487_46080 [Steroidobacter agaridevorans]|uniref:DNA helicase Pif1-like DEAD-box helicase domain-containing protein n=1 Tax=Steroidobacter agaridevorans TaxID=2695856 RepID=A0A829YIF1_9GAMM|nr:hypothetical protein [Steroidobacter agaridevorans]GFE82608.1 hypothetical protein GCM10011487_46080 [Steroidobacter agaridevorans]
MARTDPALYLPISEQALSRVLNEAHSLATTLTGLKVPELAALMLLQALPKIVRHGSVFAERILMEAISASQAKVERDGATALVDEAIESLDRAKIRAGHGLLADLGICLLSDEQIGQQHYLMDDGAWDSGSRDRYHARDHEARQQILLPSGAMSFLTREQTRIYREISAQSDDHIHVQGYAGTGKSYLIKSLLGTLSGARVLVLAERQTQLQALLAGVANLPHVYPRRFDVLAREMVPADLTDPTNLRMSQPYSAAAPIPDELVIRHLGIRASGTLLERDLVAIVRRTVARFCASSDAEIDDVHIPIRNLPSLEPTERQLVLHYATELWKAIVLPTSRDFAPPIRREHRIKWAALRGWRIPARYTHVLIDECHDLKKPMLQILDSSPQAVISLGDEYQNLQGFPQRRTHVVRQRAVTSSVRSGRLLEAVVNPIIVAHPGATKDRFVGNPLQRTEIAYYDRPRIPEHPAAILVSDTWGLFEWAQRLAAENLDVELLSNEKQLHMFVSDCIELRRNGVRPRHGEIFRYGSWQALAENNQKSPGFQRIDRMLQRGYDLKDWARTADRFVAQGKFALGLIEDVRNREFPGVMLVPELVDGVWDARKEDYAAASAALYVAVTRAQHRLIVPERLRHWLEEISGRDRASRPQLSFGR